MQSACFPLVTKRLVHTRNAVDGTCGPRLRGITNPWEPMQVYESVNPISICNENTKCFPISTRTPITVDEACPQQGENSSLTKNIVNSQSKRLGSSRTNVNIHTGKGCFERLDEPERCIADCHVFDRGQPCSIPVSKKYASAMQDHQR